MCSSDLLGEGRGRENLIIVGFVAGGVDVERHGVGDDRRRPEHQKKEDFRIRPSMRLPRPVWKWER